MSSPLRMLLLALALLGVACGPAAELSPPSGFAELEDQGAYVYRATSAQGVVLGVRVVDNRPAGNLDFWSGVVDATLRGRGYEPDSSRGPHAVEARSGLTGRALTYTRMEERRPHRYVVAVFVRGDEVFLVEAGGDESAFGAETQRLVDRAIASLDAG